MVALSIFGLSGVSSAALVIVGGAEQNGRIVGDPHALTITVGGSIDASSGSALSLRTSGAISNAGRINANAQSASAVSVSLMGGNITNGNTGKITSSRGGAIQIASGLSASIINNSGIISAATTGTAIFAGSPLTLTNAGTGKISSASGIAINVATAVRSSKISNSGTISAGGVAILGGEGIGITNAASGQISATGGTAIYITKGAGVATGVSATTITNSGNISTTAGNAIVTNAPLTLTNANTGQISSASGNAVYFPQAASALSITNRGKISSGGNGTAIVSAGLLNLVNQEFGEITAGAGTALSVMKSSQASGVSASVITNSGKISTTTGNAIVTNIPLTLTNESTGQISSASGNAVYFLQAASGVSALSITNNGKISSGGNGTAIASSGPLNLVNQTSGQITAGAGTAISVMKSTQASGVAASTITNAGRITSAGSAIVASAPLAVNNNGGGSIVSTKGTAIVFNSVIGQDSSMVNSGTIQGGPADGSGSAIVNSGNGRLSVTNAGKIIGHIVFGSAGADSLTVTGGTILGAIKGAGGNDIVNYKLTSGSTFTAGRITNLASLNLLTGTVSFAGPVSEVGRFNIAKGTRAVLQSNLGAATVNNSGILQVASNYAITGDYNQLTGGELQIDIGGADSGRLTVSGAAKFASGSAIYANITKTPQSGQSVIILSAGSAPSLATSAQSMVISSNAFVTLTPVVSGTSLSLKVGKPSLAMAAATLTANAGLGGAPVALNSLVSLVSNLNASASPGDAAEFHSLSTAISGLNGGALLAAIGQAQANPAVLGGVAAGSLNAGNSNIDTIGDRLARARANYYPATASAYRAMAGLAADAQVNVWGQALQSANQPSADGYGGYRPGTAGLIMGSDAQLTRDVRIGAAFGLSQTAVDGGNSALSGNARLQSYQGTLYASRDFGDAYLDSQLGYAYNDTRTMRVIEFAQRVANASIGGNQKTLRVASGYRFHVDGWHLTPNAHLQYARLSNNRYGESGAGALNLTVAGNHIEQAQGALGLRAAYPWATATGFFTPEFRFSLLRNLNQRTLQTNAWFADGSPALSSTSTQADRYGVNLGLNVSLVARDGLKLLLSGDYVRSGDARVYSTMFKLTGAF